MHKKKVLFIGILFVLLLLTGCQVLSNAGNTLIQIGNLSFLGLSSSGAVIGLMRLLLWILIFTLIFALLVSLGGEKGKPLAFLQRNHAMVIAFVVATIAAIFLSPEIILATGAGWGTAVALLLIGVPILGFAYLLFQIPGEGETETKWTVLLKLVLCLLLFWILTAMRHYVGGLQ